MDVPDLIRRKRDGHSLSREEIFEVVERYAHAEVPDYQCAALLMAIFFRGLSSCPNLEPTRNGRLRTARRSY